MANYAFVVYPPIVTFLSLGLLGTKKPWSGMDQGFDRCRFLFRPVEIFRQLENVFGAHFDRVHVALKRSHGRHFSFMLCGIQFDPCQNRPGLIFD